jgi:hypothetical protein
MARRKLSLAFNLLIRLVMSDLPLTQDRRGDFDVLIVRPCNITHLFLRKIDLRFLPQTHP